MDEQGEKKAKEIVELIMAKNVIRTSLVVQMVKNLLQCRRLGFDPWVGMIPWRRKWQPTLLLLPGKSHGRRSLVGYSLQGRKESDTTEQLHFHMILEVLCSRKHVWLQKIIGMLALDSWPPKVACHLYLSVMV